MQGQGESSGSAEEGREQGLLPPVLWTTHSEAAWQRLLSAPQHQTTRHGPRVPEAGDHLIDLTGEEEEENCTTPPPAKRARRVASRAPELELWWQEWRAPRQASWPPDALASCSLLPEGEQVEAAGQDRASKAAPAAEEPVARYHIHLTPIRPGPDAARDPGHRVQVPITTSLLPGTKGQLFLILHEGALVYGVRQLVPPREPASSHQAALDNVLLRWWDKVEDNNDEDEDGGGGGKEQHRRPSPLRLQATLDLDVRSTGVGLRAIQLDLRCTEPADAVTLRPLLLLHLRRLDAKQLLQLTYLPPAYPLLPRLQPLLTGREWTARFRPTLFPFQRRVVSWMLEREGLGVGPKGVLCLSPPGPDLLVDEVGWIDDNMPRCPLPLLPADLHPPGPPLLGGILSEEMGLGKTLDVMALVLLHSPSTSPPARVQAFRQRAATAALTPVPATLIITPRNLLAQWGTEIRRHAPDLRATVYDESQSAEDLAEGRWDVVLVSYTILARELWAALGDSKRPRRTERRYERKRPVLGALCWWRVCLDESQEIDSPTKNTSRMACALPRLHSWCVTGTPFTRDPDDIFGLLQFIGFPEGLRRHAPLREDGALLHRLLCRVLHRNTKAAVAAEWHIPSQHERTILLPMPPVERIWYADRVEQAKRDIHLLPGSEVARLYASMDRAEFERLLLREELSEDEEALDIQGPGDQGEGEAGARRALDWCKDKLAPWFLRLRQQCVQPQSGLTRVAADKADPSRSLERVLEQLRRDNVSKLQSTRRQQMLAQIDLAFTYDGEGDHATAQAELLDLVLPLRQLVEEAHADYLLERGAPADPEAGPSGKKPVPASPSSGKAGVGPAGAEPEEGEDGAWAGRLQSWRLLLHKLYFFLGGLANVLGQPQEEEDDYYGEAQRVRMALLELPLEQWRKLLPLIRPAPAGASMKPLSAELVAAYPICDLVAEQLELAFEWRADLVRDLAIPLDDDYERGVQLQTALSCKADAYQEILSYVQESLIGFPRPCFPTSTSVDLVPHRARMLRLRDPQAYFKAQLTQVPEREQPALAAACARVTKLLEQLETERHVFSRVHNARVVFYRRLQSISDDVVLPHVPASTRPAVAARILRLDAECDTLEARSRYLHEVAGGRGDKAVKPELGEGETCLICCEDILEGLVAPCAHIVCKACGLRWFKAKAKCVLCQAPTRREECFVIYKQEAGRPKDSEGVDPREAAGPCFAEAGPDREQEEAFFPGLASIPIQGSYGAKLDALLRHILHLHQRGERSVVFSQWHPMLRVVEHGLRLNHVPYASMQDVGRKAGAWSVFLLHATRQSSGLNLTEATHIFFLEPLEDLGTEQQAMGRIHRIGQGRETYIWRYILRGTVEEGVHAMAAQRHRRAVPAGVGEDDGSASGPPDAGALPSRPRPRYVDMVHCLLCPEWNR